MRRRIRSTRQAADLPPQREGFLHRALGIGKVYLAGLSSASFGFLAIFDNLGQLDVAGAAGLHMPVARLAPSDASDLPSGAKLPSESGSTSHKRVPPTPDSAPEIEELPQPSSPDGVDEDMATLVLDNTALGSGEAARGELRAATAYDHDPASDAAIMLRVASGDEQSFNYLVQKYHRAMIHFLFRMVRNQAVAEELAQEVFLRVYRSRESYRAEAKFTTWLYRIATNLAVNHARDTKHERSAQTIYLDQPDEESGTTPDLADDEPSAEQNLLRNERMAAIRTHVMALPERQRMAVLMHKYQGMDYREIGDVLNLSESATKSLLFRAYQTLREKLKEFV